MKTAVLLSVASLATAFVIPGNDQQLLSAFTDDANVQQLPLAEKTPKGGEEHRNHHGHHNDGNQEKVNEIFSGDPELEHEHERISHKWHHAAGLAKGLEKLVAHFEEMEQFGPAEMLEKGGKSEHGKGGEYGKKDKGCMKGAKHDEKHHEDEEHFEGKHHGKHHEKHFVGEQHEMDVFDLKAFKPCAHGKSDRQSGFFNKVMGGLKHAFGFSPFGSDSEGPIDHPPHHPPPPSHHPHHPHETSKTIYEVISGSNHTTIFTKLINQYDEVVDVLNSTQANHTIFVPIDEAFENVHHHNLSKEAIFNYLEYHISPEVFTLHDFFDVQTVPTLTPEETESKYPQRISTSLSPKGLTLNFHSHVIRPDIHATNGVIHTIDKVLIPALSAQTTIELVPSVFSTLNLALIKAGLIDVDPEDLKTGGTLLAPTNQAFAKLPPRVNAFLFSSAGEKYLKALLKYHIVPGRTLFTDAYYYDGEETETIINNHFDLPTLLDSKQVSIDIRQFHRLTLMTVNKHTVVSVANVPVKEGVIHLVSSVLIPPHPKPVPEPEEGDEEVYEYEHRTKHELSVRELMERLEPLLE